MHSPMQENHIAEATHKDTANKKNFPLLNLSFYRMMTCPAPYIIDRVIELRTVGGCHNEKTSVYGLSLSV